MTDVKRLRTEDVYPGPRRSAIEEVDLSIAMREADMNLAIDSGDWVGASKYRAELANDRAFREVLFTCSIHDISGVELWEP